MQWEKNIVPEPFVPLIHGSSNLCNDTSAILILLGALHLPFFPKSLFTLHLCGQRLHVFEHTFNFSYATVSSLIFEKLINNLKLVFINSFYMYKS